jgi:hypothetical protein
VGNIRDPSSPISVLADIYKELGALAPKGSWEATVTDTLDIKHFDTVKVIVRCSKAFYDEYEPKRRQKGEWQPEPIEITLFWRDDH